MQRVRRPFGKAAIAFQRINVACELAQHRSLIAGACADLKHVFAPGQAEKLCHVSDDEGLRNGLVAADGQRRIAISVCAQIFRYKFMAGNGPDGIQHARIMYAARAKLVCQHVLPRSTKSVFSHSRIYRSSDAFSQYSDFRSRGRIGRVSATSVENAADTLE